MKLLGKNELKEASGGFFSVLNLLGQIFGVDGTPAPGTAPAPAPAPDGNSGSSGTGPRPPRRYVIEADNTISWT